MDRIRPHRRGRDLALMGVLALALSGLAAGCGATVSPSGQAPSAPAATSSAPVPAAPSNAATGQMIIMAPRWRTMSTGTRTQRPLHMQRRPSG